MTNVCQDFVVLKKEKKNRTHPTYVEQRVVVFFSLLLLLLLTGFHTIENAKEENCKSETLPLEGEASTCNKINKDTF